MFKKFENLLQDFKVRVHEFELDYYAAIIYLAIFLHTVCVLIVTIDTWSQKDNVLYVGCMLIVCLFSGCLAQTVGEMTMFEGLPHTFTVVKSIIQVVALLIFLYLDELLKKHNGLLTIISLVSLYVNTVTVATKIGFGEDFDIAASHVAAACALYYDGHKNWKSVLGLAFIAIILIWIKNLLYLPPKKQTTPYTVFLVQYVVLRRDLTDSWPLARVVEQGCSASMSAIWSCKDHPLTLEYCDPLNNHSMHTVTLEVQGQREMLDLSEMLNKEGISHTLWTDSQENIPTCIATRPYHGYRLYSFFNKLQ